MSADPQVVAQEAAETPEIVADVEMAGSEDAQAAAEATTAPAEETTEKFTTEADVEMPGATEDAAVAPAEAVDEKPAEADAPVDAGEATAVAEEATPSSEEAKETQAVDEKPAEADAPVDAGEATAVAEEATPSSEEAKEVDVDESMKAEEAEESQQSTQTPADGEPKQPKKPGSGYMMFSSSIRDDVIAEAEKENGVKPKMGETAKLVAAKWGALSDEEKNSWKEKVAADKVRYEEEMKIYQELLDPVGTLKAKYEYLIPKKPLTFFGMWLEDAAKIRKAHGLLIAGGKQATKQHVMAKLGALWRAASEEEKAPFMEKAKTQQAEYDQKVVVWEASPECLELGQASVVRAARDEARRVREAEEEAARKASKGAGRGAKRAQPEGKDATPPKKASGSSEASPADAKKPRTSAAKPKEPKEPKAAKAKEPEGPQIDEAILKEAIQLGWESQLRNLAARPEVQAVGKSASDILESLRASHGLVNAAKRTLLGC